MSIHGIAILGAGNGGAAAAADLTLRGYDVRLYSRSEKTLQPIKQRGGIELREGKKKDFARPRLVTSKIDAAVADAELIMIVAPASAHAELVAALAPHLRDDQMVFLNPGHTGGSLHVANLLRRAGIKATISLGETVTLTYICRSAGPAQVEIYRRTTHLACAAFPGNSTPYFVRDLRAIYPGIVAAHNVLETGISNINAIMHPAGMIGNAGRIQTRGGDFYFYREGITPAIANVIDTVDRERLKIVARLGLPARSFVELFYQAGLTTENARTSGSVYEAIRESVPNRTIKSPPTLDHRYLHEDVGYGLVPISEIGRFAGIETPAIDALVTVASEMNRIDYRREGLTLDKMGLGAITLENLSALLQAGF
ncbi:MAG TPA: NAD/NADP octopine/nopaline dehydrogenase family protein [Candidatus Binatia bacterium]|jgi:opine dehydrogenase